MAWPARTPRARRPKVVFGPRFVNRCERLHEEHETLVAPEISKLTVLGVIARHFTKHAACRALRPEIVHGSRVRRRNSVGSGGVPANPVVRPNRGRQCGTCSHLFIALRLRRPNRSARPRRRSRQPRRARASSGRRRCPRSAAIAFRWQGTPPRAVRPGHRRSRSRRARCGSVGTTPGWAPPPV